MNSASILKSSLRPINKATLSKTSIVERLQRIVTPATGKTSLQVPHIRVMATTQTTIAHPPDYKAHIDRTAGDPRQEGLHSVYLSDVKEVNPKIRLIQLKVPPDATPIKHRPGQWLDVHIGGIDQIGGFTITSPPSTAILAPLNSKPYLELAIQHSPSNPPAAFFWRPLSEIRNTELKVRVGGNFVWPPPDLSRDQVSNMKRAVFIAGGVGINPLMSMLSSISEKDRWPETVRFFYSIRLPASEDGKQHGLSSVLFFNRLNMIARDAKMVGTDFKFRIIVTGGDASGNTRSLLEDQTGSSSPSLADVSYGSRLSWEEVQQAIGDKEERKDAVVYVCGPQAMTDEMVSGLESNEGMPKARVLCEKWW